MISTEDQLNMLKLLQDMIQGKENKRKPSIKKEFCKDEVKKIFWETVNSKNRELIVNSQKSQKFYNTGIQLALLSSTSERKYDNKRNDSSLSNNESTFDNIDMNSKHKFKFPFKINKNNERAKKTLMNRKIQSISWIDSVVNSARSQFSR